MVFKAKSAQQRPSATKEIRQQSLVLLLCLCHPPERATLQPTQARPAHSRHGSHPSPVSSKWHQASASYSPLGRTQGHFLTFVSASSPPSSRGTTSHNPAPRRHPIHTQASIISELETPRSSHRAARLTLRKCRQDPIMPQLNTPLIFPLHVD